MAETMATLALPAGYELRARPSSSAGILVRELCCACAAKDASRCTQPGHPFCITPYRLIAWWYVMCCLSSVTFKQKKNKKKLPIFILLWKGPRTEGGKKDQYIEYSELGFVPLRAQMLLYSCKFVFFFFQI